MRDYMKMRGLYCERLHECEGPVLWETIYTYEVTVLWGTTWKRGDCIMRDYIHIWGDCIMRDYMNMRGLYYERLYKQAGTELGQAQLKLGLEFTLIFCRFGFSPFGLIELVWLNKFGLVYLVFTFLIFCLIDSVCSFGLINLVLSQRKKNCWV